MSHYAGIPSGWDSLAMAASEAGLEFDRDAALNDLRWWQDRCLMDSKVKWPSIRKLADRWNWRSRTGKLATTRVLSLVHAENEWWDPYPAKIESWKAYCEANGIKVNTKLTVGEHSDNTRLTQTDSQTPTIKENLNTKRTVGEQSANTKLHTRGIHTQDTDTDTEDLSVPKTPKPEQVAWDAFRLVWSELRRTPKGRRTQLRITKPPALVRSAVKTYGLDAVLTVIRWLASEENPWIDRSWWHRMLFPKEPTDNQMGWDAFWRKDKMGGHVQTAAEWAETSSHAESRAELAWADMLKTNACRPNGGIKAQRPPVWSDSLSKALVSYRWQASPLRDEHEVRQAAIDSLCPSWEAWVQLFVMDRQLARTEFLAAYERELSQ